MHLNVYTCIYLHINWEVMSFNSSLDYQSLFETATRECAPIIKVAWSHQAPQVYATLRPKGWLGSYCGGAECVRSIYWDEVYIHIYIHIYIYTTI